MNSTTEIEVSTPSQIENNDPNIRWSEKTFEIDLQLWEYRKTFTVKCRGNVNGFGAFEHALEVLAERIYEQYGKTPKFTFVSINDPEDHLVQVELFDIESYPEDMDDVDEGDACEAIFREIMNRCVAVRLVKRESYKD